MALLKLDEKNMNLTMEVGILETYAPSERVEKLHKKMAGLREKMVEIEKNYNDTIKKDIMPVLQEVRKAVQDLNEERYPQLKQMREQAEQQQQTQAKPQIKAVPAPTAEKENKKVAKAKAKK